MCRTNQGPLTLRGEGRNVSLLPLGSVETRAVYICMFVRCNVMEATLGLYGSSVCQELEAKKRHENKKEKKPCQMDSNVSIFTLFTVLCK